MRTGILRQAGKAKEETEKSSFEEKVNLILVQAQMDEYISGNDKASNLENAFKVEDKNATVTKSNAVYEVTFDGEQFLVSNDYKYIEAVEPENLGDWEYYNQGIITKYIGNDTNIIIPNFINGVRIKKVQKDTFKDKVIESAIISDGIEIIGDALFKGKTIKEIVIPNSIITIEGGAFQDCYDLKYVTFGNNIEEIGNYAFSNCRNLEGELKIPNTLIKIGNCAFLECVKMQGEYYTPNSLKSIGAYAFYGCKEITGSVIIPSSMTIIPEYVFKSCKSLDGTLTIPESITRIESGTFAGCENLKGTLVLPSNLNFIGGGAFQGCSSFDEDITIPNGVTAIPEYAFYSCNFGGILRLPKSVTEISDNAFMNNNFKKIIIDNSIENAPKIYKDGNVLYTNIEYLR